MIKPEDISDDAFKACFGPDLGIDVEDLADILNAAIEAGLVSPPVYAVRDDQGNLLDYEVYGLWSNPDAAESQHEGDYAAEHWKGQRE